MDGFLREARIPHFWSPQLERAEAGNRTSMGCRPNWQSCYVSIKCDFVAIAFKLIAQDASIVTRCIPHQATLVDAKAVIDPNRAMPRSVSDPSG